MRQLSADDRLAIQDLLAKYCVYMDRRDERWMELFDSDASFEVAGREALHSAGIEQTFRGAAAGMHLASAPILRPGATGGSAFATQTFLFRNAGNGSGEDGLVRR